MNFFDVLILGFLALFMINGFRKRLYHKPCFPGRSRSRDLSCRSFSNYIQSILLDNFHPSRNMAPILSFTATFLIVAILVLIVAKVMEKIIDIVGMGFLNKLAGAMLGFVKGVVVASIILFIFFSIDKKQKWITAEDRKGSITMNKVETVFPKIISGLGSSIHFPLLNDEKKP